VEIFESETRSNTKGAKAVQSSPTTVVGILLAIVRGYGGVADADADELVTSAIKALLFYYMWTARTIREELAAKASTEKNVSYDDFSVALADVFDSRPELDDVSLSSMGTLLDLHTLFATFRNVTTSPTDNENVSNAVSGWVREVTPKVQQLIEAGFIAAEKAFAKKAKRVLEPPADDDPPDDLDSEPEDSSDEDEVDEDGQLRRAHHRQQELLLAEKRLCELTGKIVLAMLGGVIDATGPSKGQLKKRIQRNKARLGPNFKEVVSFLEEPKPKKSSKAKAQETKPADRTKRTEKSKELVEDDEDEDEIEEVVEEGGEEDLRRKELQDEIEDASDGNEGGAVADAAEDDIMGN
jgi:cohesin complex subunit SA-1/2